MNTTPHDLSPETSAWLQAQIAIGTARAVAPMRAELDQLTDWSNGIFVVLVEVLPLMLLQQPELATKLQPLWARATQRFEALEASGQRTGVNGESRELLEARKVLYRLCGLMGVWDNDARGAHADSTTKRSTSTVLRRSRSQMPRRRGI